MRTAKNQKALIAGTLSIALFTAFFGASSVQAKKHEDKESEQKQAAEPEVYTPSAAALESQKLLKTLKTPFGAGQPGADVEQPSDPLGNLALTGPDTTPLRANLVHRLRPQQLFLPGHMILGKTVQFTVRGRPGNYVALAMADKDSGAKPIFGHTLRLGPDRKVVAAAQIPESGVVVLNVDTPIEGDMIGSCMFFEAALWAKPDFSDLEIANVIPSESQESAKNGVLMAADNFDRKRGLRFSADSVAPMMSRQRSYTAGLDSGKP